MQDNPTETMIQIEASVQSWSPSTDDEVTVSSAVYQSVVRYFESLEHVGRYTGNGHHLAQRVSALVTIELGKRTPKDDPDGQ